MSKTITAVGIEKIGRRLADSIDHAAYTLNGGELHLARVVPALGRDLAFEEVADACDMGPDAANEL